MRFRDLNTFALMTVAALGMAACGGGDAGDNVELDENVGAETVEPVGQTPAAPQQQATLAEGVTQEQFDLGRQLFTGQGGCQACHGPQATGTQLAPDLTDSEWLNLTPPVTTETIVNLIETGVPQPIEHPAPMPPMGGANLNDQQVQALAGYVLSIAGS